MKSPEAMPNSAPEPQRPEIRDEDIESALGNLKEQPEETYEDVLKEAEDSMRMDIAASKEKRSRLEMSGALQLAAAEAADEVIDSNLKEAMALSESPEGVETLLVDAAVEEVRKELGSSEEFAKMHENPKVQQLYAHVDTSIRHEVVVALKARIEKLLDAAKGAGVFEKLNAILEAVHKAER